MTAKPFTVTYRLSPRSKVITGIRYGDTAESVRAVFLKSLATYAEYDRAVILSVESA